MRGTVVAWFRQKGFGFIKNPNKQKKGGKDIFFHLSDLESDIPGVGDTVEYEMGTDAQSRPCAINVMLLAPAASTDGRQPPKGGRSVHATPTRSPERRARPDDARRRGRHQERQWRRLPNRAY